MATPTSFQNVIRQLVMGAACALILSACGSEPIESVEVGEVAPETTSTVSETSSTKIDDFDEDAVFLAKHYSALSCQPDGEFMSMDEGFRSPRPLPSARAVAERFLLDELAQQQPWQSLELGDEMAAQDVQEVDPDEGVSNRSVFSLIGPSGATDGLIDIFEDVDGWHLSTAAACFEREA